FPAAALHPAAPGPALDLSQLNASSQVRLQVSDVRLDPASGQYMARLRLENSGPAIGRTLAVVFPGLPAGVQLLNPSGTDPGGGPCERPRRRSGPLLPQQSRPPADGELTR